MSALQRDIHYLAEKYQYCRSYYLSWLVMKSLLNILRFSLANFGILLLKQFQMNMSVSSFRYGTDNLVFQPDIVAMMT